MHRCMVRVLDTPRIYSFDSIIEARGMTATLLCLSSAQPRPRVTFYRHQRPETVPKGLSRSRPQAYSVGHAYVRILSVRQMGHIRWPH
jgi:hypothetical protein